MAKPWHRRRALWIFRDQTGLSVTPGLWSSIQQALDGSQYFVLLASPEAAASTWVNREIEHWVATKPVDRILPVVTDGEWHWDPEAGDFDTSSTAVPAALRGVFAEEPLFLDLRWARDDLQLTLRHSRFRDAIAQLAAPMHGMSKDDLEGEDVRQHRRVRRLWSAGVAALVVSVLVASVAGVFALRNAQRATAAALDAARQQQVAVEQRGSAVRFAEEAKRQEKAARQHEARATAAAAETVRQGKLAAQQKGLAARASVEAARQQENARQQQGIADAAAARAREQERLARQQGEAARLSGLETERQKQIAREQQQLAEESAAVARRQEQIARNQQELARRATAEARRQEQIAKRQKVLADEAAAEADRQKRDAEQQKRIAIGRRLINQAKATTADDPKTAVMLGLAASTVQPDAEMRRGLTGIVTSTHFAGTLSGVTEVAYRPDGVLVAKGDDGHVSLWDVADRVTPVRLGTLGDRGSPGSDWELSPDGRTVAIAREDGSLENGSVALWNVTRPSHPVRIATLPSGDWSPTLAFSPDGRTLAVSDREAPGVVGSLWDVTKPARPERVAMLTVEGQYTTTALVFSADSRTLVTRHMAGAVVWDVTDRARPVARAVLDDVIPWSMAFSPTAPLLAIAGTSGLVLWDLTDPAEPQVRGTVLHDAALANRAAFSADGRILASGDVHGTVTLWAMPERGGPVRLDSVRGHGSVRSIALSPDGRTLATTDTSATATLWNVAANGAPQRTAAITDHRGLVLAAAFTPDGRSMTTADADGTAMVWDMTEPARPRRRATLPIHHSAVSSATFTPDARMVAALGSDGRVTLSDLAGAPGRVTLSTFDGELAWAVEVELSPDGRTLAISSHDKVKLWSLADPTSPTPLGPLTDAQAPVRFSPDSRILAAVNSDRSERVGFWDLANRSAPARIATLVGHGEAVTSVAFSPDGLTVATGSDDRTAVLWDVTDRTRPHRLATLPGNRVTSLSFSSDGHTLALSSGRETEAMLWDVADPAGPVRLATFVHTVQGPVGPADSEAAVLSPNGRTLAMPGGDSLGRGTVRLWDHTALTELRAHPARHACAVTGRGLNAEEWARHVPELPYQSSCPD